MGRVAMREDKVGRLRPRDVLELCCPEHRQSWSSPGTSGLGWEVAAAAAAAGVLSPGVNGGSLCGGSTDTSVPVHSQSSLELLHKDLPPDLSTETGTIGAQIANWEERSTKQKCAHGHCNKVYQEVLGILQRV